MMVPNDYVAGKCALRQMEATILLAGHVSNAMLHGKNMNIFETEFDGRGMRQ